MKTAIASFLLAGLIVSSICVEAVAADTGGRIKIKQARTGQFAESDRHARFAAPLMPRVAVFFDEWISTQTACVSSGDTITLYVIAELFMSPITSIEYRISLPSILTYIDEHSEFPDVTGTALSGITITLAPPGYAIGATEPVLLQRIRCTTSTGCTSGCSGSPTDTIRVVNHPLSGAIRAFDIAGQPIAARGDNSYACAPLSDLIILSFSAPDSAAIYENISSKLSVTIANAGEVDTPNSFWVRYYLSRDSIINSSDIWLSNEAVVTLASGTSISIPSTNARIPLDAPTGNLYIGVVADADSEFTELNEENNTVCRPITIYDDPALNKTCVYAEDFQEGPAGWTAHDLTAQKGIYWQQTTYNDGTGDRGVMWCGTYDPAFAYPPGYGNYWCQRIDKSFTLPGAPVSLDYSLQYDTEQDWDFLRLQISTDGSTFITLDSLCGKSDGFVGRGVDVSAYAGMNVIISFIFISDLNNSDEDGLLNSDGACRIDWVQITGLPVDDFETDNNGWVASATPVGGEFRLAYDPVCYMPVPCDSNSGTGKPQVTCNAWVAYDPATEQFFHASPENWVLNRGVNVGIESPAISVPGDALAWVLEFDVYRALAIPALVFYSFEIAAPADGPWRGNSYVYYGVDGWHTDHIDISALMQPGATTMRMRLRAFEMPWWTGIYGDPNTPRTPSPYFDNVKLFTYGSASPGVDPTFFPRDCKTSDEDQDGVGDLVDACPSECSAPFDRNGDGCIDGPIGARHIEYLARDTLSYYIQQDGAPGISDGSDMAAVRAGVSAWASIPGVDMAVGYRGAISQQDARAMDGVNLITFSDPDYVFPTGVLAVGTTTSFTEPEYFQGRIMRPGQIVDCDMIFNPLLKFRTPTQGSGTDLRSVATHEAGHLLGLSHSAVKTSTMFYVLPPDTQAASLELEDRLALFKAYPDGIALAGASRLSGQVLDGVTGDSLCGAIVFAIDASSGDTLGSEYTFLDGRFSFLGLPDGDYYVSIYPLNGSSRIGYLQPGNINETINAHAVTLFVPEYYDSAESATDDPSAKTSVHVQSGSPPTEITIVTNIDNAGPSLAASSPAPDETGVRIDASVLASFSEAIDLESLRGNFSLTDTTTHEFVRGNISLIEDDSTLAFIPSATLSFTSVYRLELGTGVTDKFGNGLSDPFVACFTTEPKPDVAVMSIAPRKGVVGATVVIGGFGFENAPANNFVDFNGTPAEIMEASPGRLVVKVPAAATTGNVTVTNVVEGKTSNALTFTVLKGDEVARGYEAGISNLEAIPRSLAVLPDGSLAFVATEGGYVAVVVDPGASDYCANRSFPIDGGLGELSVTPDGKRVYAVSGQNRKLYRINAERHSEGLADLGVLSEIDIGAEPRGILIEPSGRRAYITTAENEIRIWDVNLGSATFDRQIGEIPSSGASLRGKMATDPAGNLLLVLSGTGSLLVYDLKGDSLKAEIDIGLDLRDVVVDSKAERAYVTSENGSISVVSLGALDKVMDISTGGALRGAAVSPAGSFLYAVNRELNFCDVIDLRQESETFRSVAANVPLRVNPVDIGMSPDGLYALSLSEAERMLVVTAIGVGPMVKAIMPVAGPEGAQIAISGSGFAADSVLAVSFNGIKVEPEMRKESLVIATVPPGAKSGPVTLVGSNPYRRDVFSNEVYFSVLDGTVHNALRLAGELRVGEGAIGNMVSVSPRGDIAVFAADNGGSLDLFVVDIGASSATFHQVIGQLAMVAGVSIEDVVLTPDGERALVIDHGAGRAGEINYIPVIEMNPRSGAFLTVIDSIDVSGLTEGVSGAAMGLDGAACIISEYGNPASVRESRVHLINIDPASSHAYEIAASASVAAGNISAMSFHPSGGYCYVTTDDAENAAVLALEADLESPAHVTVVAAVPLPGAPPKPVPKSLAFTPDGRRCLVLTAGAGEYADRAVVMVDTSDPANPAISHVQSSGSAAQGANHIDVSPRGDRAILAYESGGISHVAIGTDPDTLVAVSETGGAALTVSDIGYSSDGSRIYGAVPSENSVFVYDFSAAQAIAKVSGDRQSGVVSRILPAPLRVRVTAGGGGGGGGVPVTFRITSGGGAFVGSGFATQVALTDGSGYAAVQWMLGAAADTQAAEVAAPGLSGSPLGFIAVGMIDPATLPLRLVDIVPVDSTLDVGSTTAVQVTLSRAVDRSSVDSTTLFLHENGTLIPVPAVIGFTDGDRKLSLTPRSPLRANMTYVIEVSAGLLDDTGDSLQNPHSTVFTTAAQPPIALDAASPPSGLRGLEVVLSGIGFDPTPGNNTVLFGAAQAAVTEAGSDFLDVVVPYEVHGSTMVQVSARGQTSNELPFNVLMPAEGSIIDKDVISKVGTVSVIRSIAVTPDGARLYAVCPIANLVIVVDIFALRTIASIPVGENPYAIVMNPQGTRIYVTNFLSGTVTVADIEPGSPTYNSAIATITVGANPLDALVTPDGDRLIVANIGSRDLSIIDTDEMSETHNMVIATVGTGKTPRAMAVTPDGGFLYVGTSDGYFVIDVVNYGVVRDVNTSNSVRSVAVTPDGAFLIILTTEGEVLVYDVAPGSATMDQVVGRVCTGTNTRSVALTPDGGLLYLILEEMDFILVVKLGILTHAGVMAGGGEEARMTVTGTVIDTLMTGEDPADIAFAGDGSGIAVISNAGEKTVSIYNPGAGPVAITVGGFYATQSGRGARLQWSTIAETGTTGFNILRSTVDDELKYDRITGEQIKALGRASSYSFMDETVQPNKKYYYRLETVSRIGKRQVFGPVEFTYLTRFALEQNVPNPFNPSTVIRFSVERAGPVSLVIYDVAGRKVRTILDKSLPAGYHEMRWDGRNNDGIEVSSGIYFCLLREDQYRATRKLVLLR